MIEVVPWSADWARDFERVAADLRTALATVPGARVEHVGSTSVPGLPAKPILDIDVIVSSADVPAAVEALSLIGYVHRGDLGVVGREAFHPPDEQPRRHATSARTARPTSATTSRSGTRSRRETTSETSTPR